MDTQGDGVLSLDEVSNGFKKIFGEDSVEYKQVGTMFESLDLDGSGNIDYTEFCAAGLGQKQSMQDDILWAAFKTFDLENTGYISKGDLQHILDEADCRTFGHQMFARLWARRLWISSIMMAMAA